MSPDTAKIIAAGIIGASAVVGAVFTKGDKALGMWIVVVICLLAMG